MNPTQDVFTLYRNRNGRHLCCNAFVRMRYRSTFTSNFYNFYTRLIRLHFYTVRFSVQMTYCNARMLLQDCMTDYYYYYYYYYY
jgi:hypothetical protein